MPTWNEIRREIEADPSDDAADRQRSKRLSALSAKTGRPAIAYYSGFLSRGDKDGRFHAQCAINDLDMNGFMAVVYGLPKDNGLDLILHTPGGGVEAARGIVEYIYKVFGRDVRVLVPQIAMSAGTMIACAAHTILLAKHSCLGPIDPQIRSYAAMGILAEVDRALAEIKKDAARAFLWQQVFSKYPPAFISDCERSVAGAKIMVRDWLAAGMFAKMPNPVVSADTVVEQLMDYSGTTEHSHHFLIDKCHQIGLNIISIENDQSLQELILSVHHSFMASFDATSSLKIISNSIGATWSAET